MMLKSSTLLLGIAIILPHLWFFNYFDDAWVTNFMHTFSLAISDWFNLLPPTTHYYFWPQKFYRGSHLTCTHCHCIFLHYHLLYLAPSIQTLNGHHLCICWFQHQDITSPWRKNFFLLLQSSQSIALLYLAVLNCIFTQTITIFPVPPSPLNGYCIGVSIWRTMGQFLLC